MQRTQLTRKAPMKTRAPKPRKPSKCKVCRGEYIKRSMDHKACKIECAIELGKRENDAKQRKAMRADRVVDRAKREAMKPRPVLLKEAQIAFNAFIRARDEGKPCICCGRPMIQSSGLSSHNIDAGHYRSVGSAPHLRFHEQNCHAQLVQCNRYGAGRAVDYRLGLVERIGLANVEALEANQESPKWTHDDLRSIRLVYQLKLKDLRASRS